MEKEGVERFLKVKGEPTAKVVRGGDMERYPKNFTENFNAGEEGQACFHDVYGRHRFMGSRGWTPNTDIMETQESVVILLDLAGISKEEIRVECQEDILKVSGMRARKSKQRIKRFHRMEIDYGPFEKLFRVPPGLETDKVEAVHRDGFLELTMPKKQAEKPIRVVIVHEDSY